MNEQVREAIESIAQAVELLAVAMMVTFIVAGTLRWLAKSRHGIEYGYERYRVMLGKSLLVGLELLVAAGIIRTVTLDATLAGIAALGALVVVRTALSWSLTVEVEGRWPWRPPLPKESGTQPR